MLTSINEALQASHFLGEPSMIIQTKVYKREALWTLKPPFPSAIDNLHQHTDDPLAGIAKFHLYGFSSNFRFKAVPKFRGYPALWAGFDKGLIKAQALRRSKPRSFGSVISIACETNTPLPHGRGTATMSSVNCTC